MAKSNGDLVEAAAQLVELSGRTVASPARGAPRCSRCPIHPTEAVNWRKHERRGSRRDGRQRLEGRSCRRATQVAEGDTICILESMKMEIPVEATAGGNGLGAERDRRRRRPGGRRHRRHRIVAHASIAVRVATARVATLTLEPSRCAQRARRSRCATTIVGRARTRSTATPRLASW